MTVYDSKATNTAAGDDHRVRVRVYALTDVGHTRDHNEDTFLVADLERGEPVDFDAAPKELSAEAHGLLFLVADGMGGAASGELASGMAGQVVLNTLRASWKATGTLSQDAFATALRDATETANARIHQYAKENPEHRGMGTTATVAGLFGDRLFLAQVGDSRAYLVRGGDARQLTKDQSLMQRLVEAGELTQEEADASDRRNIILQALGPDAHVTVDLTHQQLRRGDTLILCSDGLSGLVRGDEIARFSSEAGSVDVLCRRLVDLANERGGPDNITVIAARFDGGALTASTQGDAYGYSTFPIGEDAPTDPVAPRIPRPAIKSDPTPRFGTPLPTAAELELEFARANSTEDEAAMGAPGEITEEPRREVAPIVWLMLVAGGLLALWLAAKFLLKGAPITD